MTTPHGLTTADLAAELPIPGTVLHGVGDRVLRDIVLDSRNAGDAVMFAARPGANADGHDFAPAAVQAGSPALLVERPLPELDVDQLVVPDVAAALGHAAAVLHGRPSQAMTVLGVTGTNGKTTTAYMLDAILREAGHVTGLVGTVETRIAGRRTASARTTPEAPDLQRLLAQMVAEGVGAASIEVSSHGLALGRMNGLRVAAALYTNLSQDHLDFHADMEDYFLAKARLFTPEFTDRGVVTIDDVWGERMAGLARDEGLQVLTLSRDPDRGADVTAHDVRTDASGSTFTAQVDGRQHHVTLRIPGTYNVTNALGALATAHLAGVPLDVACRGLSGLPGVPGRMERVDEGQNFGVVVDYAHTPEAVAGALAAARGLTTGQVIVVLGCGGDRDAAKRPLMARAAVGGAHTAILTSDNPRSEDPEAILDQMVDGLADPTGVRRIADRAQAIRAALDVAQPGDVVVIAGKGHETYQELASGRIDFDDREVAREHLRAGRAAEDRA